MNKKQCQKCGEENPPEAVMCWACYTPLGSAAAASTTPSRTTAARDDADKKPIPMWQMGVVGAALIVGIGMGVKTLLPGDSSPVDYTTPTIKTDRGAPTRNPVQPPPVAVPQGNVSTVPLPPPPALVPNQVLMRVEVPPNPRMDVATMAIVPTEQNVSEYKAAALAVLAHRHIINAKRWRRIQIFVFNDQQSAQMFRNYQKKRRSAPLEIEDYQSLVELWRRTPAAYEFQGTNERWVSPIKNPNDWWNRWPPFRPRTG